MTKGRRGVQQESMLVPLERGPSHTFYDRLNEELDGAAFDKKVEALCERFFETEETRGRPSVEPGMYFRMLMVGYFEGIESERGIEWRCADSLSLRRFIGVADGKRVPDHSTLSRMRQRLDESVFSDVFNLALGLVREVLRSGRRSSSSRCSPHAGSSFCWRSNFSPRPGPRKVLRYAASHPRTRWLRPLLQRAARVGVPLIVAGTRRPDVSHSAPSQSE